MRKGMVTWWCARALQGGRERVNDERRGHTGASMIKQPGKGVHALEGAQA